MVGEMLTRLLARDPLGEEQADALFEAMFAGRLDEAQIAAALALIQTRGATVDELVGAARAMRRHVARVPTPDDGVPLLDTCGTGGAPKTFNVSTAAAIVAVAAAPGRLRVAKHGNRSRTGRGSAEVLARLGVDVDAPVEVQARCLQEAGVCFCFAIHHHPATRRAAGVRRSLGFATIFNLLGPLTNPALAPRQLMGVYAMDLVEPMALALARLGSERAIVMHSEDGLDELSVTAPTRLAHVRDGAVSTETIDPATLGLSCREPAALVAGDLDDAARFIHGVLDGEHGPRRDFVLLSAAGALLVADAAPDLSAGVAMASGAIDRGDAARTLERLAQLSRQR